MFHDLGIWSDRTFDYLAPSAARARELISARSLAVDSALVERMIRFHHRLRAMPALEPQVEALRRADLVDLSLGLLRFGLPRELVRDARQLFPNAGFHPCLLRECCRWSLRHPLRPLPMLRW